MLVLTLYPCETFDMRSLIEFFLIFFVSMSSTFLADFELAVVLVAIVLHSEDSKLGLIGFAPRAPSNCKRMTKHGSGVCRIYDAIIPEV